MADFTLSTQRLPSGGSGGGLRSDMIQANGGAGSLRAAQISPNAGQARYTATNLPQPVENMVSKGTQHFLGAVSEAAFKYQEREAAYLANEAALQYQIKAREAYSGYEDEDGNFVPGLASAKGATAVTAYNDYTAALDERMNDMLSGMEPRVKQKALIQIQTAKNQALAKGATHRAQQMQVAEQDQRFRMTTEISAQVTADPSLLRRDENGMLSKDANGMDIQQRLINQYDSLEEGANAYWDMVVEVGKGIYHKDGAQAAMVFANTIGAAELLGSEAHQNKLNDKVRTWMNRDAMEATSAATLALKQQDRIRKEKYRATYALVVGARGTPQEWSSFDIRQAGIMGFLEPSVAESQAKLAEGTAVSAGDPEAFAEWKRAIRSGEIIDNVLHVERNGVMVPAQGLWAADRRISTDTSMQTMLNKLAANAGTVNEKEVTAISNLVEKLYKDGNMTYALGLKEGELAMKMTRVESQVRQWLQTNDYETTMKLAEETYSKADQYIPSEDIKGLEGVALIEISATEDIPTALRQVKAAYKKYKDSGGKEGINRQTYERNMQKIADKDKAFTAEEQERKDAERRTREDAGKS